MMPRLPRLPFHLANRRRLPLALATILLAAAHGAGAEETTESPAAPSGKNDLRMISTLSLDKLARQPIKAVKQIPPFTLQERTIPTDVRSLKIEDVRSSVLENQLEIRIERIPPDIAKEVIKEEEARFNAVFSASYGRSKTEDFANNVTRGRSQSIGTVLPLKTGGSVSLTMQLSTLDTPPKTSSAGATLSFSQPLLRNAGFRVATASLEKSKVSADQAAARAKLMVINYLSNADRAYWSHWSAWQEIDIRYEQYEMAKQQVRYAEETVKAGLIARVDIIRSQSGVARRLEDIVLAESNRRQTERELKRIMNRNDLPLTGATTLKPAVEPELLEINLARDKVTEKALNNRMDLLTAQLQTVIDAIDSDVARNQLLPLFSFNLSQTVKNWGYNSSDTLHGLREGRFPDRSIGFTLEMPFDNSGARARVRRTDLQQASNLETLAMRKRQIEKDVLDTIDYLEQSWQRILAAHNEIRSAEAIYAAELEQFRHGMRTSTDVLNAAQTIADAKVRNVRAIVDYEMAKINLAYATGTTLGYAGIEIKPYDLK